MENRTVLTASDGMILTNGENIGKIVFLGEHDSPGNWHEITESEAERLQSLAVEEE